MSGASARLVIAREDGVEVANIPAAVGLHGAAANYTFKEVGNYDISLDLVARNGQAYLFKTTEEIKFSVVEKVASAAEQMWLIGGSAGLAAAVFIWALFRFKKHA